MNKVIYEFYYNVGSYKFDNCFKCVVEKETEKMLYGNVFYESGVPYNSRFAINKSNLNHIHQIVNERKGLIYRVQVEDNDIKKCRMESGQDYF